MPYLLRIARDGLDDALRGCPELAGGVYTYRGACVQPQLAAAFKAPHRPLADVLSEPR
jgi:alanine dehydrogenase